MMRTMVLIDGENLVCRYQDMVRNGDADVAEARRRHGPSSRQCPRQGESVN